MNYKDYIIKLLQLIIVGKNMLMFYKKILGNNIMLQLQSNKNNKEKKVFLISSLDSSQQHEV